MLYREKALLLKFQGFQAERLIDKNVVGFPMKHYLYFSCWQSYIFGNLGIDDLPENLPRTAACFLFENSLRDMNII